MAALASAEREDEGERRGVGAEPELAFGEQRQHGALLAEHPADQGVDRDQQRELGGVGAAAPAAVGRRRSSREGAVMGRTSAGCRCASAQSSGPPTSTATSCAAGALEQAGRRSSRARRGRTSPRLASVRTSAARARARRARRGPPPGTCPAVNSAACRTSSTAAPATSPGATNRVLAMRSPAVTSGGDAAVQLADEVVVADLRGLPRDLGGVLVGVAHDDERACRAARASRARWRTAPAAGSTASRGCAPAAKSATGRTSTSTAPSVRSRGTASGLTGCQVGRREPRTAGPRRLISPSRRK